MNMQTSDKMRKIQIQILKLLPAEISPDSLFKSTTEINERYDLQVSLIINKKFNTEKFAAVNCDVMIIDKTTNLILKNTNTTFYVRYTHSQFNVILTNYDTTDILEISKKLIENTALEMLLK